MNNEKNNEPRGECAKAVREGLKQSGYKIGKAGHAKNYGKNIENSGFKPYIASGDNQGIPSSYQPQKGDVTVIQSYKSKR